MSTRTLKLVAATMTCLIGTVSASEQFAFRFGRDPLNTRLLKNTGVMRAIRESANGMVIEFPVEEAGTSRAGVATKFMVDGDFDITLNYELVDVEQPDAGYGAGVKLRLNVSDPSQTQVNLSHHMLQDGNTSFATNVWTTVDNQRVSDQMPHESVSGADHGQLRFVRSGSTLRFLVAEGDNDQFRELREIDLGTNPLKSVHVLADTGGSTRRLTVRLAQLTIHADALPMWLPPPDHSRIWSVWTISAVLGAGAVIASTLWWRRRRRGT